MLGKWLPALSPTAQSLFANERAADEDAALQARALERAKATLEGERWSGIQMRRAGELAAPGRRSRALRTMVLMAAALGIAGLATAGVRLARQPTAPVAVVAAAPPHAAPSRPHPVYPKLGPEAAATPDPERATTEPARAAPVTSSAAEPGNASAANGAVAHARTSNAGQYALEVGLLEPARTGIARGDYAAALSAIGRHQREYPSGQLTEEREALRVRALWGSGQKPAAEAAAAAFRRRYPRSGLLSWMKAQPAP
ncbi:MAG TPA: hypothetical protein VHB79_37060 [Polyangiaceae bacterium]|nr:hypothetical protein [Polyangiaceae bacterium]